MDFNLLCCCPGLDFRRFLRSRRNQVAARREARNCDENSRTPNGLKSPSSSPPPPLIESESESEHDGNATTQTHWTDHCDEHDRLQSETVSYDNVAACENAEAILIATEDKELSSSIHREDNDGQCHTGGECRAEAEAECSQEIQSLRQEEKDTELLSALPLYTVEEPDEEAEPTGTGTTSTTEFLPRTQLETENSGSTNGISEKKGGHDAAVLPEAKAMNAVCGSTEANREQQLERLKYFAFTCMVDMCIIALILYVYYTLYLD